VKISVLCFDLSANAVGRADLLARLVAPLGEVEVLGPCSDAGVWSPVATAGIRYRSVPARRLPGFVASARALMRLADGDLLYASKPRLASAGVGLIKRLAAGRPLVLDIDDWEVGFFLRSGFWGTAGRALNLGNPAGLPWTWLMERLTGWADALTVASRFLETRFGGLLVPHVRDTEAWRPGSADGGSARRRLGVEDERLVLFLGTPRGYKGVDDLCAAVARIDRKDVVLAIVGADPAGPTGRALAARHAGLRLLGPVPFQDVPAYLEAADVVVVPQRETPDTRGQVPAKLFDAMALGRPIVSTRVSMIPEILDGCGVLVDPGDVEALARAIERLVDDRGEAHALGARARERCVERYSFAAARRSLLPLLQELAGRR
jgi:glycosyltransferase involved in cell wall biosynthesis